MKPLFTILLLLSYLLFLSSCECYPERKGIILDEATHAPIANAQIEFGSSKILSNEDGKFEISASGCDLKMIVTKEKYRPFGVYLSTKNAKTTIQVDNEINYKDLKNPRYLNDDSTSSLIVEAFMVNSVHFEHLSNGDLQIYLELR